jgi:mRNA interferase MazF
MPSPGELFVARVTFTNGATSKRRPVLVLWVDGSDSVVAVVTTAAPRTAADVALADWQAEGLVRPSTVRLARLDTFNASLLVRRIGVITRADAATVTAAWNQHMLLKL